MQDRKLVMATAVLAKGLVLVIDGGELRAQRASALDMIDGAGRTIADELHRSHFCADRSAPVSFVR